MKEGEGEGERKGWVNNLSVHRHRLSIHSFIHSLMIKARVKYTYILAFLKRTHSSTCICMYFYFQLEQRCFTQQEQLESLQEQQEEDHLKYQKRISELEAKVEQVRGRRGGRRERGRKEGRKKGEEEGGEEGGRGGGRRGGRRERRRKEGRKKGRKKGRKEDVECDVWM